MTLSGRLFPDFVCRIAGLPVRHLEAMRVERSAALSGEIERLEGEMETWRETLTQRLFDTVSRVEDRKRRGHILQVKRDVHNLRRLRPSRLRQLEELVPDDLLRDLQAFRHLGEERRHKEAEIERCFAPEVAAARRRFRSALRDDDFQKGLLLSSRSLHGALERYRRTPVDRLGSKERQIERGLMRYFSRTAMKATPFGTLCAIAAGELADADASSAHNGWAFTGDPRRKQSRVRLNKSLYANLLQSLLRRPPIRRHFDVELNPTLVEEDGRWTFLANVNGKEVFQRLEPNPVVELLRQAFDESSHRSMQALIDWVDARPEIDADSEEIEAYLLRLLEIGLFRFRIGIREQEVDWDRPFRAILDRIEDEDARELSEFLRRLRADSISYAAAAAETRPQLFADTCERLRTAFAKIDASLGRLADLPFYEDAASAARLRIRRQDMAAAVEPLIEWIELTSRLAWPRSEQASVRHFFDEFYGQDDRAVPLLRFYEDYYREHFKSHLAQQGPAQQGPAQQGPAQQGPAQQQPTEQQPAPAESDEEEPEKESYDVQNPFGLELTEGIRQATAALTRRLQELWRADPEALAIDLDRADLLSIVGEVPLAPVPCRSASVFVQYLPGFGPAGRGGLVANLYHNGFGKYFSRFLYLLPDEVQQRLFDNNARLSEHHLAEICGDAAFNGNLHPPLLPWELSYPTGESGPSQAQLRTAEILVARDPDDPDALCLLHRGTAKRVLPVDLGFLNARMRPPLYQLLSRFTPPASFGPQVPETPGVAADERPSGPQTDRETSREAAPEEKPAVSPEEVFYRPRITYRGSLVLGRRLWIVPAAAFPKPRNDETPARYYLRVRRWRSRHGIPAEVFLQVRPLGSAGPSPAAADGPADGAPAEGAAETPAEGAAETGGEEPVAEESAGAAAAAASPGAAPRPGVGQKAGAAKAARPAGPSLRSDLYKPQYIDFHNPLLLDLFSKAPGPLEDFLIVLAERLPAREHLPSHGDDRFATELVVQIDFASHGAGGPERHVD